MVAAARQRVELSATDGARRGARGPRDAALRRRIRRRCARPRHAAGRGGLGARAAGAGRAGAAAAGRVAAQFVEESARARTGATGAIAAAAWAAVADGARWALAQFIALELWMPRKVVALARSALDAAAGLLRS